MQGKLSSTHMHVSSNCLHRWTLKRESRALASITAVGWSWIVSPWALPSELYSCQTGMPKC